MAAASNARRLRGDLEIVAFERGSRTSYSACGIPYLVAGEIDDVDVLVARTPREFRESQRIDVRTEHEVVAVDAERRQVEVRDLNRDRNFRIGFDHLVIATGARPIRPDLPGIDHESVFGVQTLDDAERLLAYADACRCQRVVVVGGGYIGLEMAEAFVMWGAEVAIVDSGPQRHAHPRRRHGRAGRAGPGAPVDRRAHRRGRDRVRAGPGPHRPGHAGGRRGGAGHGGRARVHPGRGRRPGAGGAGRGAGEPPPADRGRGHLGRRGLRRVLPPGQPAPGARGAGHGGQPGRTGGRHQHRRRLCHLRRRGRHGRDPHLRDRGGPHRPDPLRGRARRLRAWSPPPSSRPPRPATWPRPIPSR